MRWPWRPKSGMVRVGHRELVELQRGALRAAELREQRRLHAAEAGRLTAWNRAAALLAELPAPVSTVELDLRAAVLDELPLTSSGELHELAFLALVEARAWEHRDQELRDVLQGATGAE